MTVGSVGVYCRTRLTEALVAQKDISRVVPLDPFGWGGVDHSAGAENLSLPRAVIVGRGTLGQPRLGPGGVCVVP